MARRFGGQHRHFRIVDAQHRQPVERQAVQELGERRLHAGEVAAVVLEMVGVDVGDDRDRADSGAGNCHRSRRLRPPATRRCRGAHSRRRRAAGRRSRRSDRVRLRPARWRAAMSSWSCRACRRRRCRGGSASARRASPRAARSGCAARARRSSSGLSDLIALDTTTHVGADDVRRGVAAMDARAQCRQAARRRVVGLSEPDTW